MLEGAGLRTLFEYRNLVLRSLMERGTVFSEQLHSSSSMLQTTPDYLQRLTPCRMPCRVAMLYCLGSNEEPKSLGSREAFSTNLFHLLLVEHEDVGIEESEGRLSPSSSPAVWTCFDWVASSNT